MTWWHLFWGFFIANLLGYGGGPSTIPLIQQQAVEHYHWLTNSQFANLLAVGNALPGPIATKLAAAIGYQVVSWPGVVIALLATILPSAVALILFLQILNRFRTSHVVRGMTILVQPVIAVLMILLTWAIGVDSVHGLGYLQAAIIGLIAFWAIRIRKIHPAIVIVAAFAYGGLVLPHI
jgi:chromate transporter